jgi:Flp pilus assembly protein TadG
MIRGRHTMRRRPLRLLRAARDGAAAVEFAMLAVPFLMISLGIFEIGRLVWTSEALHETAAVAARCMGVLASDCATTGSSPPTFSQTNTQNYIISVASDWNISVTTAELTTNNSTTCGGVSGFSQVTINYTFQTVLPSLLASLADGVPMNVQACFPNQS